LQKNQIGDTGGIAHSGMGFAASGSCRFLMSRRRVNPEARMFRKRRKANLVGIDIGSSSIKVVELERTKEGNLRLVRFVREPLLSEAIVDSEIIDRQAVVEAIQNVFEEHKIQSRTVATAVSGRAVIVKKIWMDRLEEEDAREAILWEAEQHIPYDIHDVTLDFQILRSEEGEKQMEVLLVAAKKDMVHQHADILREAGLEPAVIDVDAFAVQNAVASNYDIDPSEVVAICDIGSEESNLNIVRNNMPLYTKDLPVGTTALIDVLKRELDFDQEEAEEALRSPPQDVEISEHLHVVFDDLAEAVERAGAFLKTSDESEQVSRLMLSGGGAHTPGVAEYLANRLQIPVELVDPLQRLEIDEDRVDTELWYAEAPQYAVSIGLALRRAA
jgi:type IV pilus assembly protein PilM